MMSNADGYSVSGSFELRPPHLSAGPRTPTNVKKAPLQGHSSYANLSDRLRRSLRRAQGERIPPSVRRQFATAANYVWALSHLRLSEHRAMLPTVAFPLAQLYCG